MKPFFTIIALFWLFTSDISAQTHYVLDGLTVLYCNHGPQRYIIDTDAELVNTTWSIEPVGGSFFLSSDAYSAIISFGGPGTYILLTTSFTADNQVLSDSLFIIIEGEIDLPEIIGCYEGGGPNDDCYEVCAHSTTILNHPGHDVSWEIFGAESYEYLGSSAIEITWGAGGEGEVFVFSQGCDISLCFNILPQPVADFTTTPSTGTDTLTVCKNQEIFFENLSFNGLNYTWLFGDGEESDGFDANHTYTTEGFYTVTLQAKSICDCYDEKQLVIEVLPAPSPVLDCVNTVCPETRQRYSVTPADCAQYNWSISPNGTIINGGEITDNFIEIIWHEGPDGLIELTVSGCATAYCAYTNVFRVPIITPQGPIEGDESVCAGEIATYTAPYFPGTVYDWNLGGFGTILGGQGTNGITVQWAAVNTPTPTDVEVTYDNCFLECGGEDIIFVDITPKIRLEGDIQVCQNQSASVSAKAGFFIFSPVNVSWHIENANGDIVFSNPGLSSTFNHVFNYPAGEYAWVATNTSDNYCTEIARLGISVTALPDTPLGIIGERKICPGTVYGYTIESAGDYGTTWFITDGASTITYDGQSCQHAFGPAPPYIVLAYHTDIQYNNCASMPVSISLESTTNLSIAGPDEVCFNGIDTFSTDYISGADYTWEIIPADHGEIRRSDLNNVVVFWSQTGNATLRLSVCGVTIDKIVSVRSLPSFSVIGPTAACANELVNLSTDQPLYSHKWFDESENVISLANSIMLPPGSFGVEVTDQFGCTNKKSEQITVYPAPSVHLSTTYSELYCVTLPGGVTITANTDGAGYTFNWYHDDVLIGPGGPVYNVTAFGNYHVEVTNQYGCKAISQNIRFMNCCPPDNCGPVLPGLPAGCTALSADFNIAQSSSACNQRTFSPDLTVVVPGSVQWAIYSRSEDVIHTSNADILNYTYEKPGYYFVIVLAELDGFPYGGGVCGHYEVIIDTIRAVADFASEGICANAPIAFEDLTTFLPMENISSWTWDFGDPGSGADNTSLVQHPSHTFATSGTYEITLTVTLASGCSVSKKHTINISGGPTLLPQYEFVHCEDEAMSFVLPGELYDIQWTFGDPGSGPENTAVENAVYHTFDLPGTYAITVEASDVYTCRSQTGFMIDIIPNTLSGIIDVDPLLPLCAGDTAVLTAPTGGIDWNWSTLETTNAIEVTTSNQYDVLITDQYHCTYSPPSVFIEVFPKPEVIIRAREIYGTDDYGPWSSSLSICYGTEFELSAFSTGNVSYHWSGGELTQILSFTNEGANLPPPGMYEFSLTTVDLMNNCISDSAFFSVEIFELPNVPVISLASGSGCSFNPNVLEVNNPQAGITYTWSDGQEGASITTSQAGAYQVTAMNQNGCTAVSNIIIINPSAQIDQIPGGCFLKCDPLSVCLPYLMDVASYTIYQNGSVYETGTSWPSDYLITTDGSYVIEIETTNGCVATSDPLDVMLYTGVGSITVETWLDQDGDGVISSGDVLLPGIPIQIISDDGLQTGNTETVPGGQFVFVDYPAIGYLALIDKSLLSSQYVVVIDSLHADIETCDDSVVVALLLRENCTVTGPDQFFELCPGEMISLGDSIWTDTGFYEMHMSSISGCDSIFQVVITPPDSFEINVVVWSDVDQNGIVSPADTVVPGVTIILDRQISSNPYTGITDQNGEVSGLYPAAFYYIAVDSTLLPPGMEILYGEEYLQDTVCGEANIAFLLESSCSAVFVVQNETLCFGDSVLIDGQWVNAAGQYTYVHTDPVTMCDTTFDVFVAVSEELIIQSSIDWNCVTLGSIAIEISGQAPFTIDWSTGDQNDTLISNLDDGVYTVLVSDDNGCDLSDTFEIISPPTLTFSIPSSFTIVEGDSVLINITGDTNVPGLIYQWSPAGILSCATCPSTYATPGQDTVVTVVITDEDSCEYFLETNIYVTIDSNSIDRIYVPNVFSPNGDGINDYWRIFSKLENTHVDELYIYDRWGTVVFAKADYVLNTFEGWDGKLNGKPMNPGVFVFQAKLTLGDGREERVKGDITLLR